MDALKIVQSKSWFHSGSQPGLHRRVTQGVSSKPWGLSTTTDHKSKFWWSRAREWQLGIGNKFKKDYKSPSLPSQGFSLHKMSTQDDKMARTQCLPQAILSLTPSIPSCQDIQKFLNIFSWCHFFFAWNITFFFLIPVFYCCITSYFKT